MQLILDSEASIDINEKMSTLEDSLDKTLNDGVETLKTAVISNGNKENIQRQENIIKHSEEEHNGVDKDLNDEVDASLPVHDKKLENNEERDVQIGDDKDIFTDVKINGFVEEEKKDLEDFNLDSKIDNATIDEKAANLERSEVEKDAEDSKLFSIDSEEINDSKNIDNIPETESNKVKEILDCSFEESKNNTIEAGSVNVPNVSDKVIDTPMEVECELEDKEKNTKETLPSETESPVIDSLGSEKDKNVTCDSKVSEKESTETDMEIDVSKPELSTKKSITLGDEEMDFEDEVTEDTHTIDEILEHITSDNEETGLENKLHVDAVLENTTLNEKTTSIEKEAPLIQSTSGDVDLKNTPIEGNISSTEKESTLEDTKTDSENITSTEKEDALEDGKQASVEKENLENNVLTAEKEVALGDGIQIAVQKETEDNVISTEKQDTTTPTEKEASENSTSTKDVISEKLTIIDDSVTEKSLSNDEEVVLKESTSEEVPNAKPSLDGETASENTVTDIEKALKDKEVLEENTSIDKKDNVIADDKEIEVVAAEPVTPSEATIAPQEKPEPQKKPYSKLSNTLDILSDDEDDSPPTISKKDETSNAKSKEDEEAKTIEKQCINIEDDDDIMLIDEDTSTKECTDEDSSQKKDPLPEKEDLEKITETVESSKPAEDDICDIEKEIASPVKEISCADSETGEEVKPKEDKMDKAEVNKPLLPENFLKTYKKNLADMTRDDLEEFCILKIVESIVDRSNLSDIKTKMKEMAQNIEEYKKKAMMLTKQNRDLQVVLKSVQEEQKKFADNPTVIKPLKITRSVGMQVLMTEKPGMRKKPVGPVGSNVPNNRNIRTPNQSPKPQKPPVANQPIPVPRLVPANNTVGKISVVPSTQNPSFTTQAKTPTPSQNGVRNSPPVQKVAEKRPISRIQSVTVDLTDDEPPAKITPRSSPAPPVRLVSPQNLLPPRQAFGQSMNTNSPRKVYIPISGPQGQNIRPGQAIMIKSVPTPGPRPRVPPPHMARMPQNAVRLQSRVQNRHPAPLPDAVKQYQPPNWKALPPAPDLKLSKVENGIVISWKIEGYQEDSYEEIASYQLYAYQETSSPPNTALWKKIGDVKALPLPMACTLTHVMAGFKYYFAVRAVDIRSRLGPFSLPGSILLLNKL